MIYIYALTDPITDEIRYIGKSVRIRERYQNHLNDVSKTYKTNWIKSLLKRGMKPGLVVLEELNDCDNWKEREMFWIKTAKDSGWRLVNSTDGGDGVLNISGEGKERMLKTWKGRKHKPETLIKLSKASKGRVKTDEQKEAMRIKMTGRKILWAEKLKVAVKKFDEFRLAEVKKDLETMMVKDVAEKYKVHRTTISKIKLGKY